MLAVVVDPAAPGRLTLRDVDEPVPGPSEAVISVAAISLNRGEVRRAQAAAPGWRPGWDLAGPRTFSVTPGGPDAEWSSAGTASRYLVVGPSPGGATEVTVSAPAGACLQVTAVPLPDDLVREPSARDVQVHRGCVGGRARQRGVPGVDRVLILARHVVLLRVAAGDADAGDLDPGPSIRSQSIVGLKSN